MDFDRLSLGPGDRVLDLGCGAGRHTFEAARLGADVTAVDLDPDELETVEQWLGAMRLEGELAAHTPTRTLQADAIALPFDDDSFDVVIAAEILEHLPDDRSAIAEIARVVRPTGRVAVTVPRWGPEAVCWALSDGYHTVPGGHVRIYRRRQLERRLARAGLEVSDRHHAHALHAPYWWLRCALGPERQDAGVLRAWHRMLVWDIERRPLATRAVERVLDPLVGKSLVLYLQPGMGGPTVGDGAAPSPGQHA